MNIGCNRLILSKTSYDNLANFSEAAVKINGSSDETDLLFAEPKSTTKSPAKDTLEAADISTVTVVDSSSIKQTSVDNVVKPKLNVLDINICSESNSKLVYFKVQRQDANKTGLTTSIIDDTSSVTSNPAPFTLQSHRPAPLISSDSSTSAASETVSLQLEKYHQRAKSTLELCDFAIEFFKQVSEVNFIMYV